MHTQHAIFYAFEPAEVSACRENYAFQAWTAFFSELMVGRPPEPTARPARGLSHSAKDGGEALAMPGRGLG